jgi:hypothetical protein
MATPTLFAKYAALFEHRKVKFVRVYLAIYIGLFCLGNAVAEWESSLGTTMFVLLIMYFATIVPYFSFRKISEVMLQEAGESFWLRAIICDLWLMFCIWFVFIGLSR